MVRVLGIDYGGRRIGSISRLTCFSFHAVKNLAMGEGGAITSGWDVFVPYGTGVYTADTSICRAGIHAGAIPKEGGTLTVALRREPPQGSLHEGPASVEITPRQPLTGPSAQ